MTDLITPKKSPFENQFISNFSLLFNPGSDITIVAHSLGVQKAMESAEILEKEGVSCEVGWFNFWNDQH